MIVCQTIPLPQTFNFSPKFSKYRTFQPDTIKTILNSNSPIVAVSAPTGSGKSLVGMVAGAVKGDMTYLTHSRDLQNQIVADFPDVGKLWGRSHYPCDRYHGLTAAECTNSRVNPCEYINRCDYRAAKRAVLAKRMRSLNYSYFLNETNHVGQFSDQSFLVCDEADILEDVMMGFIGLSISKWQIEKLGLALPRRKTSKAKDSMVDWKGWAEKTLVVVNRELMGINADLEWMIDAPSDDDIELMSRKRQLGAMLYSLNTFLKYVDDSWLYEKIDRHGNTIHKFTPLWLSPELTHDYFWRHTDQALLMSATLWPDEVLAKLLGLHVGDIERIEVPSTFPVANRPIILRPVVDMTYAKYTDELPKLFAEIRRILTDNRDTKGVIHTVSYKLAQDIMNGVGTNGKHPRLVTHNSSNRMEVLDKFRRDLTSNKVLVSPCSERGISYDGESCRWAQWAKAPYLNLKDKRVAARVHGSQIGNRWYKAHMLMTVQQGAGRIVRDENDYGKVYISDQQIVNAMVADSRLDKRNRALNGWFRDAIE